MTPFREAPWARSTYWLASMLVDERRCPDVRALIRDLNAAGIQARPLWRPLHRQPVPRRARGRRSRSPSGCGTRLFSLPSSVGITPEERQTVIDAWSPA